MRKGTFFFGSSLDCSHIMLMAYLWLTKTSKQSVMMQTGHSSDTVGIFLKHFRNLVSDNLNEENQIIGGPDIIVEIDESKFGKRKNNRGHHIEGVWVVGGVELTKENRVFLVKVENRSAKTLTEIITKYVHPESIIVTDCWKGYSALTQTDGYEKHLVVNHSKNFKDEDTGAHTNHIEATWNGIKARIKPRNRVWNGIEDHLMEFIWRRTNKNNIWGAFLDALRDTHYDVE
jgi:transposase-like protein